MTYLDFVPGHILDAIGVAGFVLYVLNYCLLTLRKVSSECITYFAINWAAATMVLLGLATSFNLASALIQLFWIAISTAAIVIRLRANGTTQTDHA